MIYSVTNYYYRFPGLVPDQQTDKQAIRSAESDLPSASNYGETWPVLSSVGCLRLILVAAPTRVGTVTRAAWLLFWIVGRAVETPVADPGLLAAIAWLAACPTGLLLDPSFTLSFRTICSNLCIHTKPHRGALSWPGACGRAASRGRILCFRYNWFGRRRQTLSLSDTRVARGNQACRGPDAVSTPRGRRWG